MLTVHRQLASDYMAAQRDELRLSVFKARVQRGGVLDRLAHDLSTLLQDCIGSSEFFPVQP